VKLKGLVVLCMCGCQITKQPHSFLLNSLPFCVLTEGEHYIDELIFFFSETGKVLTTMEAGDFFGEIGILNLDGLNK
jgi:hypothetical protein